MKKLKALFFIAGILFLFNSCGPEGKDPGTDSIIDTAKTDSAKTKVYEDPLSPPTSDYTGDHVVKFKGTDLTRYRGFFRFGKRHGTWTSFYPTGEVWTINQYDNGVLEGESKVYYPMGSSKTEKLNYEGSYKKGQRTGTWKFYDERGKLIKEEKY
jgi:hypothetical protein